MSPHYWSVVSKVGMPLCSQVILFHCQTLLLWTQHLWDVGVAFWRLLLAPTQFLMTTLMMKLMLSSHFHSDWCQSAHSQAVTRGIVLGAEAILQSALEHPFWAQRHVVGWPGLWGQWQGGRWGCDEKEYAEVALLHLLLHPEGLRRCKWPPCLCSCSWHTRSAQGQAARSWHPILGGLLGRRERRDPTHTLMMVLWPPAPKNIAFKWQNGMDVTDPWWTSLVQDRSSSFRRTIFNLRKT